MATFLRMTEFTLKADDLALELPKLMGSLKQAGVSLYGLWGFPAGQGSTQVVVVPVDPEQFRAFSRKSGMATAESFGVFMTAPNHTGALVPTLERIRSAGLHLRAIDAMAVEDDFGCYFRAEEKDREPLAKLFGV